MNWTDASTRSDRTIATGYQAVANDPKYRHFIRIPKRIIRCLDYFGVNCDQVIVQRRLRAYYLFIGVIDHAIDSGQANVAQVVLRQLDLRNRQVGKSLDTSEIVLATERLKNEMPDEISSEMLNLFRALSETVEKERTAASMAEYIEVRKRVGQLTARLSYVLIRPLLLRESSDICHFMERVGEIGCLVDSVIDLREDANRGLLGFQSTTLDFIRLLTRTFKTGASLSINYPRLFGLFLEAVADNVLDRFRPRTGDEQLKVLSKSAAPTPT